MLIGYQRPNSSHAFERLVLEHAVVAARKSNIAGLRTMKPALYTFGLRLLGNAAPASVRIHPQHAKPIHLATDVTVAIRLSSPVEREQFVHVYIG